MGYLGRDGQEATGIQEKALFGDKDISLFILWIGLGGFSQGEKVEQRLGGRT